MKELIFILVLGFFFTSCKENPVKTEDLNYPPPTPEGIYFHKNTKVLSSDESSKISSISSNSITFSSSNEIISSIEVGDVIVCGISLKTPGGFLRKVTGISKSGDANGINFITTMVPLVDLIKAGKIPFNKKVFSSNQTLSKVLFDVDGNYSTVDDQLKLNGNFNESGNLSGFLDFNKFPSISAQLKFTLSGSLDLNLVANLNKSLNEIYQLMPKKSLSPIMVWVNPPVIVTPSFNLYAKVVGKVNGSFTSGAKDNFNTMVSLDYNGSWTLQENAGHKFTFKEVEINFSSDLKLKIGGSVEFLVYELIGPSIGLEPYTRLNSNLTRNPLWILYAGVDATAGISTGWLSSLIPGKTWTFNLVESEVARSSVSVNRPPIAPSNPRPINGAQNVSLPVTLNWDCSDPDGDQLYYDLIWGIETNNPTRVKKISGKSFSLGTLSSDSKILWKIIAFDSKGDSTHGELWSFRTGGSSGSYFPKNPDPLNNATGIILPYEVSWECDDPNTPLTYNFYWGTNPNNMSVILNLPQKKYTFFGPGNGSKVYWKVTSKNSKGDSYDGPLWNFTVGEGALTTIKIQPGPNEGEDVLLCYYQDTNGDEWNTAHPDTSFLSFHKEIIANHTSMKESLIKFNLLTIPQNSEVLSAKLKLWGFMTLNITSKNPVLSLRKLKGPWDESNVTWTTKPPNVKILDKEVFSGTNWIELDVKEVVQSWINGESNYGFSLFPNLNDSNGKVFSSDHSDASKRPILEITYK
ncbi:hypothetical protein COU58_02675 [Candidatus Pacearchaeota archaeon CG10_big_fil_rev_8_21_14_0_10_32_42]|nr:MAG: hypothetical protein COU58_02675 [Candidatus Pacearchaeota archaeon CG10_big_fil_rev_8_21_14_0_10_32_42]